MHAHGCFLPISLPKRSIFFLIRNALWWELLACPPWQCRGRRGSFIIRICQGLAHTVLTLNLLEVTKDGTSEEGVAQAAASP